eukprot:SAG22_NODE_2056_length_3069_cov_2.477778_1_plen_62_part_10
MTPVLLSYMYCVLFLPVDLRSASAAFLSCCRLKRCRPAAALSQPIQLMPYLYSIDKAIEAGL